MNLSEIGNFLKQEISVTASKRADMNVEIPLYVIMPNHIHLIIIIRQNGYNSSKSNHGKFEPQRKNLASIIRGIKSATKSYAQKHGIIFGWQSRYHDRIIRNQTELNKIAHYIENNIANWQTDCFFDKQQ